VNELDALIERAAKRGYLWHRFRDDQHGPAVLAGTFDWGVCRDVVVLAGEDGSHAYRSPVGPDVFAPALVHWWYGRCDQAARPPGTVLPGVGRVWVLRALLTLPDPHEPGGLAPLTPAPKGTGVPGSRIPVRIRRRTTTHSGVIT